MHKITQLKHRQQEWEFVVNTYKQELNLNPYLSQKEFVQRIIPQKYPELIWVHVTSLSRWMSKLYKVVHVEIAAEGLPLLPKQGAKKLFSNEEKLVFHTEWFARLNENGGTTTTRVIDDDEAANRRRDNTFASFCRMKGVNFHTASEWINDDRYKIDEVTEESVIKLLVKPKFSNCVYPDRKHKWTVDKVNAKCMHLDPFINNNKVKVIHSNRYNYSLIANKYINRHEVVCIFSTEFSDRPPSNDWYSYKVGKKKYAIVPNKEEAHYGTLLNDSFSDKCHHMLPKPLYYYF